MESNKSHSHAHILFTQPYTQLPILSHKTYKTVNRKNPFHIKLGAYANESFLRSTKAYMQNNSFAPSSKNASLSYRNNRHLCSTQYTTVKSLGKYADIQKEEQTSLDNEPQKYYFPKRSILSPIILFANNPHKKRGMPTTGIELHSHMTERTEAFPLRPVRENLLRNIKLVMRKTGHQGSIHKIDVNIN
jgi:hypothetical protein